MPVTAITYENMKADLLKCGLNLEVLISGSVQKEMIVITEMVNFCYFNFLNEPARINLGVIMKVLFFICPGMPNSLDYHF